MKKLLEKIKSLPQSSGVYQFLDKDARVIYIGKAKNLRSRVRQYFGHDDSRPQIPFLMAEAVDVNYTVVSNELESAFLENTLIKQYTPKYNIDLKDDKNYAFITIDYSTEIPQIGYSRKINTSSSRHSEHSEESRPKVASLDPSAGKASLRMTHKVRHFGPYSAAWKIKNTLNLIRKIFPFCAAEKVSSRPCFYFYMHRCPGVCVGKTSLEEYQLQLNKIIKFLQGDIASVVKEIKLEMTAASTNKYFEAAARLRDQLKSLEILQERQNVIMPKKVDWDIVSIAKSDGYSCINLFKIRDGKMFDKENFIYEIPAGDGSETDIEQRFLEQYYIETSSAPKSIYTQMPAVDADLIKNIISSRFKRKVVISVPQKGKINKLIALGKVNAQEYLNKWLSDKAGSLDKINKALEQLKDTLDLPQIPKRIECYDISNIQGTNPVGSMVVFKDGLPAKAEYRKFKIRKNPPSGGPDDFSMMKEMLSRRLARSDKLQVTSDKSLWPLPDLMVIDGGKGQLGVAVSVISAIGGSASGGNNSQFTITVIGLAKRIEEIFVPDQAQPIILSHDQPALQLLQRLRDEAHRFGITFHRKLRSKQAIKSALDEIAGVGPKTKKLLKAKFGTVANIKKTSPNELAEVVGEKLAKKILASL